MKPMVTKAKDTITLGADVGGRDADLATNSHIMLLRRLLAIECVGPYSSVFKEFALVLRIDGSVQSWGKRGIDYNRLQKKSGYATADIFVPKDVWQPTEGSEFRCYVEREVGRAIRQIADRAIKANVPIADELLIADVDRATSLFLSQSD